MRKKLPCLSRVKNYHQMAITCRASSEHPEMPQVVLLLKMPSDSTSWTGTQATIHDPLRSPSHEQDPRRRNAPMSRVLRAAPLILNERSNILTSTEKSANSKADPQNRNFHSTQKSEPRGRKEDPLPAVHINSLEVHQGPPRPDQRSAYRENISL